MTKDHKGHFSEKHPPGLTVDPDVAAAVIALITNGQITCAAAFSIAAEHAVAPSMVGAAIDLQESRITQCQLGLFGYGLGPSPLSASEPVDDDMKATITAELVNGRLPCQIAWKIADKLNLPRLEVARACESMKIRINQCQLGTF